jgi:endoribonuclease LACTB2
LKEVGLPNGATPSSKRLLLTGMYFPLTFTVNATHYYLISCAGGMLLIDAGWELKPFLAQLKAVQVPVERIRYVMFTHHHPDHAGLVQDIKTLSGAQLIIHPAQIPFLENFRAYTGKKWGYKDIRVEKSDLANPTRALLHSIGVAGEILLTPGHSDDSISLVLDNGAAFIGDLPSPEFVEAENLEACIHSWQNLLALGAQRFYHSHTEPIEAERLRTMVEGL